MDDDDLIGSMIGAADGFVQRVNDDFDARLAASLPVGVSQIEVEVVFGLLARQVTLAEQLAISLGAWNHHVAPLYLRAMADVHIALAWLLGEPEGRCRLFVDYGLGEEKKQIEHRRRELEGRGACDPKAESTLDLRERWLRSQRMPDLTEVNLGAWSGLSTRHMAEQAGCLDFYNYVYVPFSSCAHSTWNHVARFNLLQCSEPLHGFHRVPTVAQLALDPHYLYLAGKYVAKSLRAVDAWTGFQPSADSTFDWLCATLREVCAPSEQDPAGPEDSAAP